MNELARVLRRTYVHTSLGHLPKSYKVELLSYKECTQRALLDTAKPSSKTVVSILPPPAEEEHSSCSTSSTTGINFHSGHPDVFFCEMTIFLLSCLLFLNDL